MFQFDLDFDALLEMSPEERLKTIKAYYETLSDEEMLAVFFTLLKWEGGLEIAKEKFPDLKWDEIEEVLAIETPW